MVARQFCSRLKFAPLINIDWAQPTRLIFCLCSSRGRFFSQYLVSKYFVKFPFQFLSRFGNLVSKYFVECQFNVCFNFWCHFEIIPKLNCHYQYQGPNQVQNLSKELEHLVRKYFGVEIMVTNSQVLCWIELFLHKIFGAKIMVTNSKFWWCFKWLMNRPLDGWTWILLDYATNDLRMRHVNVRSNSLFLIFGCKKYQIFGQNRILCWIPNNWWNIEYSAILPIDFDHIRQNTYLCNKNLYEGTAEYR